MVPRRAQELPEPHPSDLHLGLVVALPMLALVALGVAESRRVEPPPRLVDLASGLGVQWVDRPAPSFDLPRLGGGRVKLVELAGRPVLVHFWASWCPSCLPELSHFSDLQARFGAKGLRILHVSLDESWDTVRSVLPAGFGQEVLLDPGGEVARTFGTEKLPEAYLLDRSSRVLLRFVSTQPWGDPRMLRLLEGFIRG